MYDDPIIQEIREIRRQIEGECGNDPAQYADFILREQAKHKDRLVCGKPVPITTPTAPARRD
jgi:hypothetical protein